MSENLKPCPASGSSNRDGSKWNALPRRGDAQPEPEVTREQISEEIVALTEGSAFLDTVDQEAVEVAVRARMKWLMAQSVPEVGK